MDTRRISPGWDSRDIEDIKGGVIVNNVLTWFKCVFAFVGGTITAALGGWDLALQVLVLFVVLDYMTGLVAAWYSKTLNSQVGFQVASVKRCCCLSRLRFVMHWIRLLGQEILRSLAIFFYMANEGLSNHGESGLMRCAGSCTVDGSLGATETEGRRGIP
jgi:toxin secretion/phage lysis holin